MKFSILFILLILFQSQAQSYPTAAAIVKQLSSVLKWTTARASSPKTPQNDGDALQFESGYFVETLVEGGKLGVVPYTIRVSPEGELLAVDAENHNIVRITPPLSQYSRARLVAGSFQGYSGHVDGKPSDARFNWPKGVTMDEKGNVYVADTSNFAIRKIGEAGVTTIAGGKSNTAGYRDGPSEDAKFSNDFDLQYIGSTCSLLVVDRGNAALRQISLQQEDCDQQYNSISTSDIMMVLGAVLAGYISCLFQQGFSPFAAKVKQASETVQPDHKISKKPTLIVESLKEEPGAGWPSLGRLLSDLFKFAMEAIGSMFLNLVPQNLIPGRSKQGLAPLKDNLVMPEDQAEPSTIANKQVSTSPVSETHHTTNLSNDTPLRTQKSNRTPKYKDPSLSGKHRTKRQDYAAEFYGSAEGPQVSSKGQKERSRHRHRDKSAEVYGAVGTEAKPVKMKPAEYSDAKFDEYTFRDKYGADTGFRY